MYKSGETGRVSNIQRALRPVVENKPFDKIGSINNFTAREVHVNDIKYIVTVLQTEYRISSKVQPQ